MGDGKRGGGEMGGEGREEERGREEGGGKEGGGGGEWELGKGRRRVGMEWTDMGSFPQLSNNGSRHICVHM